MKNMFVLLAVTTLFTACNDNTPAPVADTNNAVAIQPIVVSTKLTQGELDEMATADSNERMNLPSYSNRANGLVPDLAPVFTNTDLQSSLSSVNADCAMGHFDENNNSIYLANWSCDAIRGSAQISAQQVDTTLDVTGAHSTLSLKHAYTIAADTQQGVYIITRTAKDIYTIAGNALQIEGPTTLTVGMGFVMPWVRADAAVAGYVDVIKNGGASDRVTLSSSNTKYMLENGLGKLCDGTVTYSTASGLSKSIQMPICPPLMIPGFPGIPGFPPVTLPPVVPPIDPIPGSDA